MRTMLMIALVGLLAGCGRSSIDNELVGQPKKVLHVNPLICPDYYAVDISLGVMRDGVGSMSTQDEWFYIPDHSDIETFKTAVDNGSLVKVRYDVYRVTFCVPNTAITHVEVTE